MQQVEHFTGARILREALPDVRQQLGTMLN